MITPHTEQVVAVSEWASFVRATDPAWRWTWWSAPAVAPALTSRPVARCFDIAAVHRLLAGGAADEPARAWAYVRDLPADGIPADRQSADDLFAVQTEPALVRSDGHLDPRAGGPGWSPDPSQLLEWARLAAATATAQADRLAAREHGLETAASESAAAQLCLELERDGLPVDRVALEQLLGELIGPRPRDEQDAAANRRARDAIVWRHAPAGRPVDLRNPAVVRDLLRSAGIVVDDTRAWQLEPYRAVSPLVDALLTWRKAERIATTYGWSWVERCLGSDDRLRGPWHPSDGGAGRMTAGAGLHSLPAPLRPAIAAPPGRVLVRADLGQVEPRVLAVVSGDPAFAQATRADDLYAVVARQLAIERPVAKIAVLAAMYGQTSGSAGQALARLERAYPVAMDYLRTAARQGESGEPVETYGGRLVPVTGGGDLATTRARGRFTRNAVVQGAAAELFKAWALTVRHEIAPLGGRIVMCLHDELLVEVPQEHATAAAEAVDRALADASRRWSHGAPVRFVSDTQVVRRWSEAKG
ncbi:DNA polymerase I [Calidifontibacter sp. DB0510]|uniref:DNA-directed DNA polymerase n=1 Tax=Metallococcus carri TaxID=1656884 RepID=A0A967B5M8_9MICO|nr:DNA polymerase [Metallococcus carri]NHN56052.1 DNA polymerase I [Metallococcus carri]NOP37491.1 DNA polymerase I [Calidifontibacter sp. DB2511S]